LFSLYKEEILECKSKVIDLKGRTKDSILFRQRKNFSGFFRKNKTRPGAADGSLNEFKSICPVIKLHTFWIFQVSYRNDINFL
jgi:hypothetical protein